MPIYEYACDKCSHEFEVEQRITDAPVKTCPSCRGRKVRRLISRTSFVLKGGGWYSDLYSSQKPTGSSDGDGDKGGAPDAKPGAKDKDKGKGKGKAAEKSGDGGSAGNSGSGKSLREEGGEGRGLSPESA